MLATLGGHIVCVHMLLERGSKSDTGDRRNHTALHYAVSICMCVCRCTVCTVLEHHCMVRKLQESLKHIGVILPCRLIITFSILH